MNLSEQHTLTVAAFGEEMRLVTFCEAVTEQHKIRNGWKNCAKCEECAYELTCV